jgi:hypothetical protein
MGSIVGHEQAQAPKQRVWPLQWPCAQLQACMLTHRGLAATPWHLLTQAPTHLDKLVARGSVVSDQPLQRLWAASDAIRCRVHDHHTCEQQPRDGSCRHTDVCTSAALRASQQQEVTHCQQPDCVCHKLACVCSASAPCLCLCCSDKP